VGAGAPGSPDLGAGAGGALLVVAEPQPARRTAASRAPGVTLDPLI
jgi:galactokinase/mevalonate kinase-like predicted kinase